MTIKTIAAVLATGSFLAVNLLNTNLLFSQSTLQIGEASLAQSSGRMRGSIPLWQKYINPVLWVILGYQ
ncbi:hypothetical protein [Tolypothrix sp. VBCCA 56010]|uniref:hypothetical protein n=1 Tax=Tolypothrix sp. VBCCA 56010 TaxID=3137731 RepID=UPI003D7CBDBA